MPAPFNIDNYQSGVHTVTPTASQLFTGDVWDTGATQVTLQNDGSVDVYLGKDSGVSSSTAFYRLGAGEIVSDDSYQGNLWVVTASSTASLRYEASPKRGRP